VAGPDSFEECLLGRLEVAELRARHGDVEQRVPHPFRVVGGGSLLDRLTPPADRLLHMALVDRCLGALAQLVRTRRTGSKDSHSALLLR